MRKPDELTDTIVKKAFTDRDEPRKLFWEWYEKASAHRDDFFVLSYYGIGGIGKSSLINQLCRELTDRSKLYIKYDFESAKVLDPYNIVVGLKQTLRNKYSSSFHFPLMNAALLVMAAKSDLNFDNDELVKSIVSESPYFGHWVDALGLVPLVGGPIQNTIKLWTQLNADLDNLASTKDLQKKYRQAMDEIKYLEASELQQKMPYYFRIDMTENIRNLSMPLVIFLDTYEKYIDTHKDISNVVLDSWLWEGAQSLIQRIPSILWVISGRDMLSWGSTGEWDDEHLASSEVKDFLNLDSIKYLHTADITDDRIIARICEITKGVPIYLSLCVDTYYLIKSQGKEPDVKNYKVNQHKIANHYVKYLDHANRTLINMLAAMGSWRDDEAQHVGEHSFPGIFSVELYDAMIKHSYIKTDDDGKRRMHSVVIDSLMSEITPSTLNKVNADLFHYRVKQLDATGSLNDLISAVDDAVDCFCKISEQKAYDDQYTDFRKLTSEIKEIRKSGLIYESLRSSTKLNEYCTTVFQNSDYYYESLMIQGDSLRSTGKYKQALENDKASYESRQALLGEKHPDTLTSLNNLAVDYKNLGLFDEALKAAKKAYDLRKLVLGEDHPATLTSLNNLAMDYSCLGRFDKALNSDELAYNLRKLVLGEKHPDTLKSLNNLAMDYNNLGLFDEAFDKAKQAYDLRKIILGEKHPDTLKSLSNLAVIYKNLGLFDDAFKTAKQAYDLRKPVLGEEHPDTNASKELVDLLNDFLGLENQDSQG